MTDVERRVALFVTCIGELAEPDVPAAVVRVLRRLGFNVEVPEGQTCCGQPAWNSGHVAEAAKVASATLAALDADPDIQIVVPAGSCATMIRLYWPQMFELSGDAVAAERARRVGERTREFTELVAEVQATASPGGVQAGAAPGAAPVAYHHSCHMTRELHLRDEPLDVLAGVGCAVADWPDAERCCGFGGTFAVKLPETSVAMADEKLASLPPDVSEVVGADSSCLLHLRARAEHEGVRAVFRHVAEVLDQLMGDGSSE